MNSLNLVSRLGVTPPPSPPRSRSGSVSQRDSTFNSSSDNASADSQYDDDAPQPKEGNEDAGFAHSSMDEKSRLLGGSSARGRDSEWRLPKRITEAVFYGVHGIYMTITAPFRYVVACFYDENGTFSAVLPMRSFKELIWRRNRRSDRQATAMESNLEKKAYEEKAHSDRAARKASSRRSPSVDSNSSHATAGSSDGEADDGPARNTRSRSSTSHQHDGDESAPQRTSIRIKVSNDESLRKRKASKSKKAGLSSFEDVALVASALKSPTSHMTSSRLTKYPRAPAPPRPLVPRRQPSYALSYNPSTPRKTLIIDLDETLIHSMAKGGRMSTGHMVEVRLNSPAAVPSAPNAHLPPNIPILYYVHERPFCHEFLRKVSTWYNCVIFTASVQEYADPVIDWLERERKYFTGRYYRQHCTLRGGAYIKDLSVVEPDLSRVAILDNSPVSYGFNEGEF